MYIIKLQEELKWGAIVAVATYLFQIMAEFKPEIITDWKVWAISIGGGLVRALGASLLVIIGKAIFSNNSNG